jgi:polar amino acid transport system substrate-binding protein
MTNQSDAAIVAPGGVLRVGIAVGPALSAMWTIRDPATGQPRGVTVELGRALAERLGLPLQLVEHASSGEVIKAAAGAWDVAFTPVDAERKTMVLFGPNYALGRSTYMVPAGSTAKTLADIDQPGMRVAGVENTATIRSARRTLTNTTATGITGLDEAVALFRAGEVDALALGGESIRSLLPQFPGSRMLDESFHEAGTALAVPLGHEPALRILSELIEDLKRDGTVRRAFDANGMQDAEVAPAGSYS